MCPGCPPLQGHWPTIASIPSSSPKDHLRLKWLLVELASSKSENQGCLKVVSGQHQSTEKHTTEPDAITGLGLWDSGGTLDLHHLKLVAGSFH